MKNAENNEVDLLLRLLANGSRRKPPVPGASGFSSEQPVVSDHLDADELNSYAEGVVPTLARARYTEHLADCEKCRRIVVGLSQTAGVTRQLEVGEFGRLKFWNNIAALFSAPVLRYAVPALALTAVIAIGLFALRTQRHSELVARNQPINSPADSTGTRQPEVPPSDGPVSKPQTGIVPSPNTDLTREKNDLAAPKGGSTQAPVTGVGSGDIASSLKNSPPAKSGDYADLPSYAPEPPPPKPAAPFLQPQVSNDKVSTVAKNDAAEREAAQERGRDQTKTEFDYAKGSPSPPNTGANTLSNGRIAGLAAESKAGSRSDAKDKKVARDESAGDESKTRTVSGRHFRHRGNTWIDTAYDSQRETINVARGSEHFRSLAADEPGLRAIAGQLSGEIIVVWKGQAYRIH